MDTKISRLIVETIRDGISRKVEKSHPRSNFEVSDFDPENLAPVLSNFLGNMGCNHLFLIKTDRNSPEIIIFDKLDIKEKIINHLDGSVVSIVDPSTLQGVTFDIDTDRKNTFTLTGWGDAGKKIVSSLVAAFPTGVVFEGN